MKLSQEDRQLLKMVVLWARELEKVQQVPNTDMREVIALVERRFGIAEPAEVVHLRPFRVIDPMDVDE